MTKAKKAPDFYEKFLGNWGAPWGGSGRLGGVVGVSEKTKKN